MDGRLRHLLIAALLALHGPVAVCGPGSHAVAGPSTPAGDEGGDLGPAVRADVPCPICDFHLLGQLPPDTPPAAVGPLAAGRAESSHPPVLGRPGPTGARPRAPPRSPIAHGPRD